MRFQALQAHGVRTQTPMGLQQQQTRAASSEDAGGDDPTDDTGDDGEAGDDEAEGDDPEADPDDAGDDDAEDDNDPKEVDDDPKKAGKKTTKKVAKKTAKKATRVRSSIEEDPEIAALIERRTKAAVRNALAEAQKKAEVERERATMEEAERLKAEKADLEAERDRYRQQVEEQTNDAAFAEALLELGRKPQTKRTKATIRQYANELIEEGEADTFAEALGILVEDEAHLFAAPERAADTGKGSDDKVSGERKRRQADTGGSRNREPARKTSDSPPPKKASEMSDAEFKEYAKKKHSLTIRM